MTDYSYALGPVVALLALGVLVLMCRWAFSTSTRDARARAHRPVAASVGDYGLLVPVATTRAAEDAELLRGVLTQAGIRATVAPAPDGAFAVLVFRADALRARDLVAS